MYSLRALRFDTMLVQFLCGYVVLYVFVYYILALYQNQLLPCGSQIYLSQCRRIQQDLDGW